MATASRRAGSGEEADAGGRSKWRRYGAPTLVAGIVGLAAFLIYRTLSQYEYDEVVASVTSVPAANLLMAGAFAAASYACLTLFDFLALHYAGKPLLYPRVALASFTALSLGHNIGFAALSSGTVRYRYYSRWGLDGEQVAKVILFCGLTVGLGLVTLGGLALALAPDLAAEVTGLSGGLLAAAAALCLAAPATYLVLAATVRGTLRVRSWSMEMPSLRLAVGQVVIGPVNFALVAACLHQALSGVAEVDYLAVVSVYVLANVATLISHVPGGLGVIEAVVVYLLPQGALIGAVLVFRFVYFLVPLALGGLLFALSELAFRARSGAARHAAT